MTTNETLCHLAVAVPRTRGTGAGTGHARLVAWFLRSCPRKAGRIWKSNATIGRRTGIGETAVDRALALLVAWGEIKIIHEQRPEESHRGRSIILQRSGPRLPWPSGEYIGGLWALARSVRGGADARPCALVEIAIAAWLLTRLAGGEPIAGDRRLPCSIGPLRTLLGVSEGRPWSDRLRELEAAAVIRRASPGKTWRSTGLVVVADLMPALRARSIDPDSIACAAIMDVLEQMADRHGPVVWPGLPWLTAKIGAAKEATARAGLAHAESLGLIARRPRRVTGENRGHEILVMSAPGAAEVAAEWAAERRPTERVDAGPPSDGDEWSCPDYVAQLLRLAEEVAEREAANDGSSERAA